MDFNYEAINVHKMRTKREAEIVNFPQSLTCVPCGH